VVRAGLQLLPGGASGVVRAVDLGAQKVPAVTAGHAQGLSAEQQPGRDAQAVLGGAPQREVDLARRAAVAHGRDAAMERVQGVAAGAKDGEHVVLRRDGRVQLGLGVHGKMHMAVDHSRHDRPSPQVDGVAAGQTLWRVAVADVHNTGALDRQVALPYTTRSIYDPGIAIYT